MIERLLYLLLGIVALIALNLNNAMAQPVKNLTPLADKSQGLERHLLTFEFEGLTQHALVILNDKQGKHSNDLVVMTHGFHPDPANYGRVGSGESLRPGDYYRKWVELYALAGYNVLVPDYRGHNDSQGLKYTHQAKIESFPEVHYARDVVASVNALERSLQLTYQNIAIIGHSMGSPIAFNVAQQLGSKVKVTSLWSSAKYKFAASDNAVNFVIHHGKYDQVTPLENSDYYLAQHKKTLVNRYVYPTDLHMLTGEMLQLGVKRDVEIINKQINREKHVTNPTRK